jgi:regulatory protein
MARQRPESSLKARALRLLARREHSREELKRKLAVHVEEGEDLEALLDELVKRGWLSDVRFAEQSIRAKARRFGPLKLAQQLRAKGIDEETIARGFRAAAADGASSLESVWKSRFGVAAPDQRELARQARFLQGRGFPLEDVMRFLRSVEKSR